MIYFKATKESGLAMVLRQKSLITLTEKQKVRQKNGLRMVSYKQKEH